MARNVIESDFRSSKMAAGSHIVKEIIVYLSEMARNAIKNDFRSSKMAAGSHFVKFKQKIKVAYWSKMARNVIESDFRSSKIAAGSHIVKEKKWGEGGPQWPACKPFGDIHS